METSIWDLNLRFNTASSCISIALQNIHVIFFSSQKVFHLMLLWVDPTQAPPQPLADSPHPRGTGQGIGRAKMRKLMSWDKKNSLIGERERKQNEWCKGNRSPSPTSRPMPRQSPSNGHLRRQQPPWLLHLHQFLFLSTTLCSVEEYPFCQFGSAVLALSPTHLLPTPSLLTRRSVCVCVCAEWDTEKALTLCKHCSVIAKIFVN